MQNYKVPHLILAVSLALTSGSSAGAAQSSPSLDSSTANALRDIEHALDGNSPESPTFEQLIEANAAIGLFDDPSGFKNFWDQNKSELVQQAQASQPQIDRERLLVASYALYVGRAGQEEIAKFFAKAAANPYVNMIGGALVSFVKGAFWWIVSSVGIAISVGVFGDMIKNFFKTPTDPLSQKALTTGNTLWGGVKVKMTRWLFAEKTPEQVQKEIKDTKAQLERLRQGILGSRVDLSLEQLYKNLAKIKDNWIVQKIAQGNLSPDQIDGRNLFYDAVSARVMTNANGATISVGAADTALQGALSMIKEIRDKAGQGTAEFKEAGRIGYIDLPRAVARLTHAQRFEPQEVEAARAEIEILRSRLTQIASIGDDPAVANLQSGRVVSELQDFFNFMRQGAAALAHGKLHDVQFMDIIEPVLPLYEKARAAFGIDYLNSIMADGVVEELNQVQFACDVAEAVIDSDVALGWRPSSKTTENQTSDAPSAENLARQLTRMNGGSAAPTPADSAERGSSEIRFKPAVRVEAPPRLVAP